LAYNLYLAMKLTAEHQPTGDIGSLQMRACSGKMCSQISCNRDQDMPPLLAGAPQRAARPAAG
jgi:hypothetical protein